MKISKLRLGVFEKWRGYEISEWDNGMRPIFEFEKDKDAKKIEVDRRKKNARRIERLE